MNWLVSIIVPIYKVEPYLDQCVQSIVDQTYANLEIILVDDGSPDNCPAMCDAWAEKDSRIRVIHKANGGVSSARNAGLDMATGSYIAFVDADDWLEPAAVEILLEQAVSTGADIVVGNYYFDYVDGRSAQALTAEKQIWKQGEIMLAYIQDRIRPEVHNKLYTGASIGNLRFVHQSVMARTCCSITTLFQRRVLWHKPMCAAIIICRPVVIRLQRRI